MRQTQQSANGSVLRTTSATWTASGKPATTTDANGNVTRLAYDLLDRLSTTSWPGGSYETLGYDANGNVTSRGTRAGQPIAYAYGGLNRLVATPSRHPFGSAFPPPL